MTVTHMHTPGKDVDKGGSGYVYATCVICSRKIRRWTGSEGAQWEVLAEAKQPVVATATVATLAVPKDVKDAIDDDQLAAVARSANALSLIHILAECTCWPCTRLPVHSAPVAIASRKL